MTTNSKEAMRILRERLIAEEEGKKSFADRPKTTSGDPSKYPFYSMDYDKTATIRLLPDHADAENPWFWVEKEIIRLPFAAGVVGGEYPTDKAVVVEIPCVDMFSKYVSGMSCPIIAETKPWWKDESKKESARTYYKKKSWLYQGFVVSSPIEEKEVPENPIRRFEFKASIHNLIKASLRDPEMEDLPVDYQGGSDFRIIKTKTKGEKEYASYDTSSWSRRSRPLGENELIAIEQYGLFNLKNHLGRIPDADELAAIKALFHDSLAGKPFDYTSYGQWYRAYTARDEDGGFQRSAEPARTTVRTPGQTTEAGEHSPESVNATPANAPATGPKPDPKDILARIRDRTAAAGTR